MICDHCKQPCTGELAMWIEGFDGNLYATCGLLCLSKVYEERYTKPHREEMERKRIRDIQRNPGRYLMKRVETA